MRNLRLNASSIRYRLNGSRIIVEVRVKQDDDQAEHMVYIRNYPHCDELDNIRLQIGNMKINFAIQSPIIQIDVYVHLLNSETSVIIPSIQTHVESFFQKSLESHLRVRINEALIDFPKIEGIEETYVDGENVDASTLERFFTVYPKQKRAKFYTKHIEMLEEDSQIFSLDCLFISISKRVAPMVLKHFKGSNLFLHKAQIKEKDVAEFIQKWAANEAYHNLEHLTITRKSGEFRPELILEQVETREWDRNRRPRRYHYCAKVKKWFRIKRHEEEDRSINCQLFLDVTNKYENKMASIGIFSGVFQFCVWPDSLVDKKSNG